MHATTTHHQVGRHRAQPAIAGDSTRDGDVGAGQLVPPAEAELIAFAERERSPHRDGNAVDARFEVGSADCNDARAVDCESGTEERALETRRGDVVADEEIGGRVGKSVHRASWWDAGRDGMQASEVLDGREETRRNDAQDVAHASAAKNFTRSPTRNSDGGSESGRKSRTDVRPMRCHPPGLASG